MMEEIYIPKLNETIVFHIGKNKMDNFNIIDNARENDLWFHIDEHASCHVIASVDRLNLRSKDLLPVIKQGALMCKKYSRFKSMKDVSVVYTKVKHVTKTERIGCVQLSESKTIKM